MNTTIDKPTTAPVDELMAQLDQERLRSISLSKYGSDLSLNISTTKRQVDVLALANQKSVLAPLVLQAQAHCIGKAVVYMDANATSKRFEMVLENGFAIRTID